MWRGKQIAARARRAYIIKVRKDTDKEERAVVKSSVFSLRWAVSLFFFFWVFLFAFYLEGEPGETARIYETITVDEAARLIEENKDNPDFVILDVRTSGEYEAGHLESAINIDFYSDSFEKQLGALDRGKIYLQYCRIGGRSKSTLAVMKRLDFREVYNMDGGFMAWGKKGYPFVK
jgi:rhodanese-related sulfurtransferase